VSIEPDRQAGTRSATSRTWVTMEIEVHPAQEKPLLGPLASKGVKEGVLRSPIHRRSLPQRSPGQTRSHQTVQWCGGASLRRRQ